MHCAHASAYHGLLAPKCQPENRARSECLCSRVHALLGRAEAALWHGRRCLDICEENAIGDWDLAYALEAIARGYGVAGEQPERDAYIRLARDAGGKIADVEDRKHFDEDYATL